VRRCSVQANGPVDKWWNWLKDVEYGEFCFITFVWRCAALRPC
jgi:hypothetical protein